MSVARKVRRNAKTTRMTRMTEISSVNSISCTEARTVVVRSRTTLTSIAGEMEDLSSGNAARTRSTVAMMFAPGCRKTMIRTAGLPPDSPILRMSSTESLQCPHRPDAPARHCCRKRSVGGTGRRGTI